MIKVVLDTNIFISGIFWQGNYCSQIIDLFKEDKLQLITSIDIIEELVETLQHFKIQLTQEKILGWEKEILARSYIVDPKKRFKVIEDDPDDNKFLEAVFEGQVDFIVSQDKHLLRVGEFHGIKIIKPDDLLSKFFQ